MKWIVTSLILLGFGAAICAAILVGTLRAGNVRMPEIRTVGDSRSEILVASRALPAMTVIDAGAVTTRDVPDREVPKDAAVDLTNVIGRILVAPMVEGQTFTGAMFAAHESGLRLATSLPPGRRAMSTFLSTESGIEDIIYPGAVVDVIASFRLPAERGTPSGEILSSTLLQSVQVLAIGPRTIVSPAQEEGEGSTPKQKRMVTLMVTPEQAEVLQLATAHGQVTLALRHPLDGAPGAAGGTRLSELDTRVRNTAVAAPLGASAPVATPAGASPEAVWSTVILRGGTAETKTFPLPAKK